MLVLFPVGKGTPVLPFHLVLPQYTLKLFNVLHNIVAETVL